MQIWQTAILVLSTYLYIQHSKENFSLRGEMYSLLSHLSYGVREMSWLPQINCPKINFNTTFMHS